MATPFSPSLCSRHIVRHLGLPQRTPASSILRRRQRLSLPRRLLQTSAASPPARIPDFAFAFDIDGVLVRSNDALPRAKQALSFLQQQHIPFILLTNGGGKHETERVEDLSRRLEVPLDTSMFVQSHTPFQLFDHYKDKTILVAGGDGDKCRVVAEKYGFTSVITPGDLFAADPSIWPFSRAQLPFYQSHARPLPNPLPPFSAIFVYNDPRDWGLDLTVILDLLLSQGGYLGTLSPLNNRADLPNRGYQQDAQPELWFANPDLWWAAKYHLPRLGQGGFREALEGVWAATTGGPGAGVELRKRVIGKPHRETYEFAEKRLVEHRRDLFAGRTGLADLKRVYMVGDNPESDIRGGNNYDSPVGTKWETLLVKTGVYNDGEVPSVPPTEIVEDVWDAVQYAVQREGWEKL